MDSRVDQAGDRWSDMDPAQDFLKPTHDGINDKIEPIAVIGFDLRFPQDASSAESFWQLLVEARSTMTEVPANRYNVRAFYHPDHKHGGTVRIPVSQQVPLVRMFWNYIKH
jgi:hypothetical protein